MTLRDADGSLRDVTALCRFEIEPAGIATVMTGGVVVPRADGLGVLRAIFQNETAEVDLRVERADWRPTPSFRTDIVPLLSKAGCNMGACHGNLNGKGGFKLSLRGEDPAFDYQSLTHDQFGRRVNRLAPESSLIVLKPTGGRCARRRPAIRSRLDRGRRPCSPGSPRVPATIGPLRPGSSRCGSSRPSGSWRPGTLDQQLVVTAEFDDGTTRDVTRQAAYDVSDPTARRGLRRRTGSRPRAVRDGDRRPLHERPGDQPAGLPGRPARFRLARRRPPSTDRPLVFAKLKALRINPSPPCGDSVFLRRAFLDAIGRLPDPDETPRVPGRSNDPAEARASWSIAWSSAPSSPISGRLKWADLLRNEEKTMGEKGAWVFQRWLRDELARDVPLDAMVRRIVAGLGSTWQNPPASFYRTNRDPTTAAESVGQVFLGIRLQCARCHNHPFDVWTQDDYYGLAAFFANIARKQPNNVRKDRLDKHEINGDEIIYLSGPPRDGPAADRRRAPAEVSCMGRARSAEPADEQRPRRAGRLADARQSPVQPEPGQPGLVPPARPGHRRAGRRFPRLEPPVQPRAAGRGDGPLRRPRDAAQAAGRLDHEVADLPG